MSGEGGGEGGAEGGEASDAGVESGTEGVEAASDVGVEAAETAENAYVTEVPHGRPGGVLEPHGIAGPRPVRGQRRSGDR